MWHTPVLKKEVLSFLRESDCTLADLTAGLGGHSLLFLEQQQQRQGQNFKLFLVDRDEEPSFAKINVALVSSKSKTRIEHMIAKILAGKD